MWSRPKVQQNYENLLNMVKMLDWKLEEKPCSVFVQFISQFDFNFQVLPPQNPIFGHPTGHYLGASPQKNAAISVLYGRAG